MTQQRSLKRVFVEGVVIVSSILLAFSIDAWWDGVQDRSDERLVLEALQVEFADNLEDLRAVHQVHVEYAAELSQLVNLMASVPDGRSIQVADSLLQPLISFRTADPAMGALTTLLASGRIDLIRNQPLQQALAGWPAQLEDTAEDETLVRDFVHSQLISGLIGDIDLGPLLAAWSSLDPSGRTQRVDGQPINVGYPVGVSSSSRTLIGHRFHLSRLVVMQSQDRLDTGAKILSMIDRELDP